MLKFSLKMVRTRSMTKDDSVETTAPIIASTTSSSTVFNPLPAPGIPVDKTLPTFKRRIVNVFQFFGRVCQNVSMLLGVIGGVHALYELYLSNIEQKSEKLEVLVLRRSY